MTDTNLMELALKVEGLTGPDREMDANISEIVTPWLRTRPCGYVIDEVLAYTASLDAAMTLIEDGDEWDLSTVYCIARAQVGINRDHQNSWPGHGEHAGCNPVLALLAAALRARAQVQP